MLRNLSLHQKIEKLNVLKFLSVPFTGVLFLLFMAVAAAENGSDKAADAQDFSIDTVIEYARQLAKAPYKASDRAPEALLNWIIPPTGKSIFSKTPQLESWLEPSESIAFLSQRDCLQQVKSLKNNFIQQVV